MSREIEDHAAIGDTRTTVPGRTRIVGPVGQGILERRPRYGRSWLGQASLPLL